MRIVLVNWAKIWEGANVGGGVNQYVQALALELVRLGHDVVSLTSGTDYYPSVKGLQLRREHDWFGVKIFTIVNSPIMSPALAQFDRPADEISCPSLEKLVGDFFDWLRPAAVHWNNIEGFSAGCVAVAKNAGARNIVSLHNYQTICPQVFLMKGNKQVCTNFDNGHACVSCCDLTLTHELRKKYLAEHANPRAEQMAEARRGVRESVGWMVRGGKALARLAKLTVDRRGLGAKLPGRAVRNVEEATGSYPGPWPMQVVQGAGKGGGFGAGSMLRRIYPEDPRGRSPHLLAELNPPAKRDLSLPQYQPISNEVVPEPKSEKELNEYGRRRRAMIEAMNGADCVLAVSDFVRRKFMSMGVRSEVIRTLAIGSRINRVVSLKPELAFAPPPFECEDDGVLVREQRAVRILFIGFNNYFKGLGFYADVLEDLEAEVLRKLELTVFAQDGQSIEWMFRRLEPRLAKLRFGYKYWYHDIPWLCGGQDLVIVPSIWWDNGPQTVFEAFGCGVPVLGANIGGIPDFVRDGENGILFRSNDREDLKAKLREIVRRPGKLNELRKNVRPPKSIEEHAEEMVKIYADGGGQEG